MIGGSACSDQPPFHISAIGSLLLVFNPTAKQVGGELAETHEIELRTACATGGSMAPLGPFQTSVNSLPSEYCPMATQLDGDVHETALRNPLAFGPDSSLHVLPFHSSIPGTDEWAPTTIQNDAEGHEIP